MVVTLKAKTFCILYFALLFSQESVSWDVEIIQDTDTAWNTSDLIYGPEANHEHDNLGAESQDRIQDQISSSVTSSTDSTTTKNARTGKKDDEDSISFESDNFNKFFQGILKDEGIKNDELEASINDAIYVLIDGDYDYGNENSTASNPINGGSNEVVVVEQEEFRVSESTSTWELPRSTAASASEITSWSTEVESSEVTASTVEDQRLELASSPTRAPSSTAPFSSEMATTPESTNELTSSATSTTAASVSTASNSPVSLTTSTQVFMSTPRLTLLATISPTALEVIATTFRTTTAFVQTEASTTPIPTPTLTASTSTATSKPPTLTLPPTRSSVAEPTSAVRNSSDIVPSSDLVPTTSASKSPSSTPSSTISSITTSPKTIVIHNHHYHFHFPDEDHEAAIQVADTDDTTTTTTSITPSKPTQRTTKIRSTTTATTVSAPNMFPETRKVWDQTVQALQDQQQKNRRSRMLRSRTSSFGPGIRRRQSVRSYQLQNLSKAKGTGQVLAYKIVRQNGNKVKLVKNTRKRAIQVFPIKSVIGPKAFKRQTSWKVVPKWKIDALEQSGFKISYGRVERRRMIKPAGRRTTPTPGAVDATAVPILLPNSSNRFAQAKGRSLPDNFNKIRFTSSKTSVIGVQKAPDFTSYKLENLDLKLKNRLKS